MHAKVARRVNWFPFVAHVRATSGPHFVDPHQDVIHNIATLATDDIADIDDNGGNFHSRSSQTPAHLRAWSGQQMNVVRSRVRS